MMKTYRATFEHKNMANQIEFFSGKSLAEVALKALKFGEANELYLVDLTETRVN